MTRDAQTRGRDRAAHDGHGLWLVLGRVLLVAALVLLYRELYDLDWRRAAQAAGQPPWWRPPSR